jgi:hypothetical protein
MNSLSTSQRAIPTWVRYAALAWLIFWFITYWIYWGPSTFLFFCDLALILTCLGLFFENSLLVSTQALSSLVIDAAWALDAASRLLTGRHLIGGTEYLFDPSHPLWVRLITLYHLVLPFVLLWAIARLAYDRRALQYQSALALIVFIACRFSSPDKNINFAFRAPIFHRQIGPASVHVALTFLALVLLIYLPTHLTLSKYFHPASPE